MRDTILEGRLEFPGTALFELYPEQEEDINRFWGAVWHNYLNDSATNSLFWYEKLGQELYNEVVRRLSHHEWIVSNALSARKYADVTLCTDKILEYVTVDELEDIKAERKYDRYLLTFEDSTLTSSVRQNGVTRHTGLVREGFMEAGKTEFGYDMEALERYEGTIIKNLTKSIDKIRHVYPEMKSSSSSYDEVSIGIYEWHKRNNREVFTTGNNVNDSRGRAISNCLRKVANPLGSKDFRAALIITYDEENTSD